MILVDIKVPAFDAVYDFQLDEEASIYNIIGEIAELISAREHCEIKGQLDKFMLCIENPEEILDINKNLREYGITTGASLIFL